MVTNAAESDKKRKDGRFDGYRVNREYVPCLPARIVSQCLSDPRRVPYLLLWRGRHWGVLQEVVRLASSYPTVSDWLSSGWVEVKRPDGSKVSIRLTQIAYQSMLICNFCQKPRWALYGWQINEVVRSLSPAAWPCRVCAGLSYASEGGALVIRHLLPQLKPFSHLLRRPNPGRWEPLVFASPWAALEAGLCRSKLSDKNLEAPTASLWPQPEFFTAMK
jgi:hypothetical protein